MEIILLVLNKLFQTQFFLPYNQKHQETYLKKKKKKTTIQNNKKEREKQNIVTLFYFK